MNAITGTAPVWRAMDLNTLSVGWKTALRTTRVDIMHEFIGPMIPYNTWINTVVWPCSYLDGIVTKKLY